MSDGEIREAKGLCDEFLAREWMIHPPRALT
jgi:hypothetical protein